MQADFSIDSTPEALLALDRRGLLAGASESVEDYLARIQKLQCNIAEFDENLSQDGRYDVDGIKVFQEDRIEPGFFDNANAQCLELFGFSADWVPAFFINPSFSLLFGGCSFSFMPDFFAMFIVRRSFKHSPRWLIYGRDELIAHEMCHVARTPLLSRTYEESFAYSTSKSSFRKCIGGIFLSQWDSLSLLGSTFLLLVAQLCNLFLMRLPMWIFWLLPLFILSWLVMRYWKLRRRMSMALDTLRKDFAQNAAKVLFRCSDEEIDALSEGNMPDTLTAPGAARTIIIQQWTINWDNLNCNGEDAVATDGEDAVATDKQPKEEQCLN